MCAICPSHLCDCRQILEAELGQDKGAETVTGVEGMSAHLGESVPCVSKFEVFESDTIGLEPICGRQFSRGSEHICTPLVVSSRRTPHGSL